MVVCMAYHAECYTAFGNLAKNDSVVLKEFKACMYDYEDESKFHEAWYVLLYEYKIGFSIMCKFAHIKKFKVVTLT